ncbi:hypothetical protein [Plantactinospora sp. WMMB782]|uniref:hypothetical protein n=1 Tax=Plantactinospora sp. WMMB782 TaxID=3404121 RepID=UPI003B926C5C
MLTQHATRACRRPVELGRDEADAAFKISFARRSSAFSRRSRFSSAGARMVTVADSYIFLSEDQPSELARLIVEFAT